MAHKIKKFFIGIFSNRPFVLMFFFGILGFILIARIFQLQIISGQEYADNFTLTTTKTRKLNSSRGNIYDCNGNLIAYNELSNSVVIEDNGTYETTRQKNLSLNSEIYNLVKLIESCGDATDDNFHIDLDDNNNYVYDVGEGTTRDRFRADIYGESYFSDLTQEQATATPDEIMDYLAGADRFALYNDNNPYTKDELSSYGLPEEFTKDEILKIVRIRYQLSLISYQRYVQVTIASDVSDKTVAAIEENSENFQGVSIEEGYVRVYNYAESMASIIGYTGVVSSEELSELQAQRSDYTNTSIVGKAGIEQYMETTLQGIDGSEEVAVNNLGTVLSVYENSIVEPQQGDDVYLTIDAELQEACYNILEQRIAGILVSNIIQAKTLEGYVPAEGEDDDVVYIPIYDVYNALISNNIIDINAFANADSSPLEKEVYERYLKALDDVLSDVSGILTGSSQKTFSSLDDEMQEYISYIINDLLIDDLGIISLQKNYESDEVYQAWKDGSVSVYNLLFYEITNGWVDLSAIYEAEIYTSPAEVINALSEYIIDYVSTDKEFAKIVYKNLLFDDLVLPGELCRIMYEQGVFSKDDDMYLEFSSGRITPYSLIISKITSLELTPAQLALDPCSGSMVIVDPDNGNVLALVSYPGYDNNRLANTMDTAYYWQLYEDSSSPFYNKATQQLTAPGSTFKPVMVAAGLTEGVINEDTEITCSGLFGAGFLDESDQLHCWKLSGHGSLDVVEALENSCNVFFSTVGYMLGENDEGKFSSSLALEKIQKYASMFCLDEKTNIQIYEASPNVSTSSPIPSSIGQGTHSYTTTQLARYASIIYNDGIGYDLNILSKITDSSGNVIKEYDADVAKVSDLSSLVWTEIHQGMRKSALSNSNFADSPIELYSKTGTAEEDANRPSHALFIGHSSYETNDDIAFAVRIAFGYSSSNAAAAAKDMLDYYYSLEDISSIITGRSATEGLSTEVTD